MKTRRSSMVSIDTVTGPFSMTPNDTWIEVDGGKPTGNANSFPLDDTGSAQKEIIRQVNQNRNDVTSLAARIASRIARSMTSGQRYKSAILVKIILSYDSDAKTKTGNEPEYEAQQGFLEDIPEDLKSQIGRSVKARIEHAEIVAGLVSHEGVPIGPRVKES